MHIRLILMIERLLSHLPDEVSQCDIPFRETPLPRPLLCSLVLFQCSLSTSSEALGDLIPLLPHPRAPLQNGHPQEQKHLRPYSPLLDTPSLQLDAQTTPDTPVEGEAEDNILLIPIQSNGSHTHCMSLYHTVSLCISLCLSLIVRLVSLYSRDYSYYYY